MNQSFSKTSITIWAALCAMAAPGFAEAQTRHELKLHKPGLVVTDSSGAAAPLQLQLSSTAVDFGNVATHTTVKRQVLASNIGGNSLTFRSAPQVTGAEAFGAGLTSCGASLPVGAECLAEVLFSPTSVGDFSGLLSFSTSLASSPHKVSLAAKAFNPVSLAAAALPAGTVGQAYAYDFKSLLGVSNEASPDKTQATWSGSGSLPAGLTLNSSTGVLSGTPTTRNAGAAYTVIATYKNNQGQQVYTLQVGSDTLEVVQISAGGQHTCAVTPAGGVKCWGRDDYGQLGNDTALVNQPVPVTVSGFTSGAARVAAGAFHTCVVTTGGGVKCWGSNSYGQLGASSSTSSPVPVDVSGLTSGVSALAAGGYHTCALTSSGGVKCWGNGTYGQLGNGGKSNSAVPVNATALTFGVAALTAGDSHTCAVTSLGGAKCWGLNNYGVLGNGSTSLSRTPVDVVGLTTGVSSIVAGYSMTCAVTSSGGAKCWGENTDGQLGDGSKAASLVPVNVTGLTTGVRSLVVGRSHACALTVAGGAKCWGQGGYGQLGHGGTTSSSVPVSVAGLAEDASALAAGSHHTCALSTLGDLKCWGVDDYGQLGDGPALVKQTTPSAVSNN